MRFWSLRTLIETLIAGAIALALALLVFGPIWGSMGKGLSPGDMLSTYVNVDNSGLLSYAPTTHYGYPLGMDLRLFPGIDITQVEIASLINALGSSAFLGINLLLLISFPLVAMLAYLTIRIVRLSGPLAIALAVAFTVIPYHFGRGLGHMYLATLYGAVTGVALALLIGTGTLTRILSRPQDRAGRIRRILVIATLVLMVVATAWSGVYYAAFGLILGMAAVLWRVIQGDRWRALLAAVIPVVSIGVLAIAGLLPSVLALRGNPPLEPLGIRLPYESVILAGNLAMALLPAPTSTLALLSAYNTRVLDAVGAAPALENTTLPNFGTWITTVALLVFLIALARRGRTKVAHPDLAVIAYLIVVVLLFFVPWGLNYLLAGTVTPQIRAWNRLLPDLLLLFILGAAAAIARSRWAVRWQVAIPVALAILLIVTVDTVLPFRPSYAQSASETGAQTDAARAYALQVNAAVPENCGVLQLPYVAFPEQGPMEPDLNDYEHFWQAITNKDKSWSYGAVRSTSASVWAAALPQVPTDEQLALLARAGFCGIHLDQRGYRDANWADITADLTERLGPPVATGKDGQWQFFRIPGAAAPTDPATWDAELTAYFHAPMITADPDTVAARGSRLDLQWWWTTAETGSFELREVTADHPVAGVTGMIRSAPCGPRPVTITLASATESAAVTVPAEPKRSTPFTLALKDPAATATLTVSAPGEACVVDNFPLPQYAQVIDLRTH